MQFYSQDGDCYSQDSFLKMNVFKDFKNGFFVDVGAHDGVTINNTLFFEKNDGWRGINIEPLAHIFEKLKLNRPECININAAVDTLDGYAEFSNNTGRCEMLSGLKKYYNDLHIDRINRENKQYHGSVETITVKTRSLESIFSEHNVKHINYLSIDTEGAEFAVIKSINFDKVFIDVIGFENNYDHESGPIVEYLVSKNYKKIRHASDIFMLHNNSQFNGN